METAGSLTLTLKLRGLSELQRWATPVSPRSDSNILTPTPVDKKNDDSDSDSDSTYFDSDSNSGSDSDDLL